MAKKNLVEKIVNKVCRKKEQKNEVNEEQKKAAEKQAKIEQDKKAYEESKKNMNSLQKQDAINDELWLSGLGG